MEIRPAREQDQATITRMVREARLNPFDLRWSRFLVAEDESGIIGAVQVRPHPGAPELASLVVRVDRRDQGVGGELVRAMLARFPEGMVLFCRPQLESYYTRFGFRTLGLREAPAGVRAKYALGRALIGLLLRRTVLLMQYCPTTPHPSGGARF